MSGHVTGAAKTPLICASGPPTGAAAGAAIISCTARTAVSFGRTPGPKPQSTGAGLSSSLIVGAAASSDDCALAFIAKTIPRTARHDPQRFHFIVPLHAD